MIFKRTLLSAFALITFGCAAPKEESTPIEVYETSAAGHKLKKVGAYADAAQLNLVINPKKVFQTIEGFGGALTESSSHLLQKLPTAKREEVLAAYFTDSAAAYNIVRLHINSCDFSLGNYAYIAAGDTNLSTFDVEPDRDDIIPIAKEALKLANGNIKFFASPWTAPPWMKDNKEWNGGKLLPEYRDLWANYFVKYEQAYEAEGIPIWGFTVENEPLGNDANWESMHFSPEETADFVGQHLAPALAKAKSNAKVLVYDQNRGEELEEWADALLSDTLLNDAIYGTAVHWYTSTFKWFPESLQHTHNLAPNKAIWNTEACVDAEVPHWQDDAWYWTKEATDWGYTWAKEEDKADHPKYVPVYRYARDIIGCLNNWVGAWVDWNIVLDRQGGPNHASNWCIAPVIADTSIGEVYFTPLYYTLRHFSGFIEEGAQRVDFNIPNAPEGLHLTVVQNPDGSLVIPILNTTNKEQSIAIKVGAQSSGQTLIPAASIQTIVIPAQG
jgi:glucosylceramidase